MKIHSFRLEAQLWSEPYDSSDCNSNVWVTLEDGTEWWACFLTYQNLQTLRKKNQQTEENLSGAWFWAKSMCIIDVLTYERVGEILGDLVNEGLFTLIFEQITY